MSLFNYRKFKKTTGLRAFATPNSVRVLKNLENGYRNFSRLVTSVEHQSSYKAICHIGLQKTGSVWFREMFADVLVYKYSGLNFVDCAGRGSEIDVVSGLYSPIRKPFEVNFNSIDSSSLATVVVVRHPFSLLLSWIKSTKGYHISGAGDNGMTDRRSELLSLSGDDQVKYAADYFSTELRFEHFEKLLSLHSNTDNSIVLRYEDCVFNAQDTFTELFGRLDIAIPSSKIQRFVAKHSFEAYAGRSIESEVSDKKAAMQGATHLEIEQLPSEVKEYVLGKVGPLLKSQYGLY